MTKTFTVDSWEHDIGDKECVSCWRGYPHKCSCGGLVHAEFGDYTSYDSFYLEKKCDKCGDEHDEVDGD